MSTLNELKEKLGSALKAGHAVRPHEGLPTSHHELNQFLLWNGFPKGGLSLLRGHNGLGATSLWTGTAARLTQKKKWAAWLSPSHALFPLTLEAQGVDLSYMWTVAHDFNEKTWLWILTELIQSELFDLVGCDLADNNFSTRNWNKLQRLTRSGRVATIFLQRRNFNLHKSPLFSLSLEFTPHQIQVHRALHRPTPILLPRRNLYAHLMPQLTKTSVTRNRRSVSEVQPAPTIPQQTAG